MLPLVLRANTMVLARHEDLLDLQALLDAGEAIPEEEMEGLRTAALLLRIRNLDDAVNLAQSSGDLAEVIEEALYKLDVIPSGLAMGQAAYESGYGTSRFTIEGNALFGQWAFGGEGLVPEQQREELGDRRIASFDSVRGYFLNLMSHPAYEDFRRIRA